MSKKQNDVPVEKMYQWVEESKVRAQELIAHSEDLCEELFDSGDLSNYLDLLCRLHCYDTRNLLLIDEQFPNATCLAGYKFWERQLRDDRQVLKREWIGKGIDLIAPFTEVSGNRSWLTWYSVRVYDVSQTTATYTMPASVYLFDHSHVSMLLESAVRVLSNDFHRSVLYESASNKMIAAKIPGKIYKQRITVRKGLNELEQMKWLIEVMVRLSVPEDSFSEDISELVIFCGVYCLSCILGLPTDEVGQWYKPKIQSVPKDVQMTVLDLIRQILRDLDSAICTEYLYLRSVDSADQDLLGDSNFMIGSD